MQLARPIVRICIKPSGDVVVSTRIRLKALIKVSLWVVEEDNKLQIEIGAASSLLVCLILFPSVGITVVQHCNTVVIHRSFPQGVV